MTAPTDRLDRPDEAVPADGPDRLAEAGDCDGLDRLAEAGDGDAFYYEVPEVGLALLGLGVAAAVEARGPDRFAEVQRQIRAQPAGGERALWVGGFGFGDADPGGAWAGYPAARWWLPRRLWVRRGNQSWSAEHAPRAGGGDGPRSPAPAAASALRHAPGAGAYRQRVQRALAAIARGELEKVVIARATSLALEAPVDVPALLRALRRRHPACAVYAVKRGDAWFAGATPERLLRRRGGSLEAAALAGSARRGASAEEDARLARRLLESKKEQSEHAVAVRGLREQLAGWGGRLQVPESPELLRLAGVQHLCTRIRAEWDADAPGLLEIAGRVHPTAAVCGAPRAAARRWLEAHEGLDRGWYSGLVGWLHPDGDGELSAALRCALLRGAHTHLFAGAGIVAGSDPESEVRETRLKWDALLPALGAPSP